eukprot:TRINITY_DN40774_c0_g1_i1.p1 TRINITY_DN40774_c0_g1~~TRINITY_DN40774_c0_g1_i1.p1  ORF type:complete len:598 (-),score=56.78 TRINITY_DN40774_c0_g1_i1:46-1839(-)
MLSRVGATTARRLAVAAPVPPLLPPSAGSSNSREGLRVRSWHPQARLHCVRIASGSHGFGTTTCLGGLRGIFVNSACDRRHRWFSTGPYLPDEPTVDPEGDRPFDLGPFLFYRVPESAEPGSLVRWVMRNVCSNWDAAQKLISAKQVWVVPPDHTTFQHRGSIMIPRFRPKCQGSTQLQPNDYVYFPRNMRPRSPRRPSGDSCDVDDDWLLRRVLYKDTDLLVIDKPPGWAVAPGKWVGDAHLQRLLPTLKMGLDESPKFVHRLSTELCGVLVLARHRAAAAYAKDMVRQRAFWQRSMWAVVCGRTPPSGTVSIPLAQERHRSRDVSKPRREDDGGLAALTEYKTLRFSPLAGGLSLLELTPYSGRHHQVRAHCAFGLRTPIVGDGDYYYLSNQLNTQTDYRVQYHSEDSRRERKELLGPMPHIHLFNRQILMKTFGGKHVLVTAPLPPHMRATFDALGWSQYAKREDAKAAEVNSWRADKDSHLMDALMRFSRQKADTSNALARDVDASREFKTGNESDDAAGFAAPDERRRVGADGRTDVHYNELADDMLGPEISTAGNRIRDKGESTVSGRGRRSRSQPPASDRTSTARPAFYD